MEVEHDDIAPMEIEEETPQRPRKKLTQEHLAKMKAGRLRYLAAKKKAKVQINETPMIIDNESSDSEEESCPQSPEPKKTPKKKQKQKKTRVVNNYYYNQQEESSESETDEEVENNYFGQGLARQNSMAGGQATANASSSRLTVSPPTHPDYIFR